MQSILLQKAGTNTRAPSDSAKVNGNKRCLLRVCYRLLRVCCRLAITHRNHVFMSGAYIAFMFYAALQTHGQCHTKNNKIIIVINPLIYPINLCLENLQQRWLPVKIEAPEKGRLNRFPARGNNPPHPAASSYQCDIPHGKLDDSSKNRWWHSFHPARLLSTPIKRAPGSPASERDGY